MKSEFKTLFLRVRQLVNQWDPIALIEGGAPVDEYDALTNTLCSGFINGKDAKAIRKEIVDLLGDYYGSPINEELTHEQQAELDGEILNLIQDIKN